MSPSIEDLIGIEHSKLNFFQELRQKIHELEASSKESEERRREIAAILDGITDIMMVLNEDLEIISVNHVFKELFPEYPDPEGMYCYQLFRGERRPCAECPAFRSLSTDTVARETAIFKIGGRNMQFEMVASPLKNPDWPQHRVLIFKRDVTLEKEYQAKFYQAEKMATIGVLAAGVAHEVNNPLAAVTGFAEGLRRRLPKISGLQGADPEVMADFHEYLDTILKECHRCRDIVQTLLTFSRPISSAFQPVSLNRVVEDSLRLLYHQLKKRPDLSLRADLASGLPLIRGDEPQLKQVALNLLTNALDAVDSVDGEKVITVSTRVVDDGDSVVLEVRDTGCGIPKENLDKLFEPFYTTKPVGKGIGIGLATCYSIVREHHGDIRVESEPDKGSAFSVHLPMNMEDAS